MARGFEAALRAAKKLVEVIYYERSGHNALFSNAAQFDDVVQRVSDFLQKELAKLLDAGRRAIAKKTMIYKN